MNSTLSDRDLTEKLRSAGIRVHCLSHYFHQENKDDTHCLVVNYANLNEDALREALERLPEVL